MPPVTPRLLLPTKNRASQNDATAQMVVYRTLERWSSQLQAAGGGAGGYASLTGPGQSTTPGDLTQAGGFTINTPSSSTMGVTITNASSAGIGVTNTGSGGTFWSDTSTGGFTVQEHTGAITIQNFSTTGGLDLIDAGGEIFIHETGGGSISIVNDGTGGGMGITDNSNHGITISAASGGGVSISNPSGTGTTGMSISNSSGNGLGITDNTASGITITTTSTGNIQIESAGTVTVWSQLNQANVTLRGVGSANGNVRIDAGTDAPGTIGGAASAFTATSTGAIQFVYNYRGTLGGSGNIAFRLIDGASGGGLVDMYVYQGSPVGHITPEVNGSICFDTSTPGLWIYKPPWTMYTNP